MRSKPPSSRYAESGSDVIIGLGGGSCIDAAKGVAILSGNGGRILGYEGVDKVVRPIPPTVMVPSTSGTGADVSQFAIVTDTAARTKITIISRTLVPEISVIDPRLLTTMPEWLSAATGLDALTHGIESFVSRAHNPLTDRHALHAVALITRHLLRTQLRPNETASRLAMAQGSLEAGMAFTNAILGATHAMSHQVGGLLDAPHGVVNAVLLPHVIRFNAEAWPQRFVPLAAAGGISTEGVPADEVALMLAERGTQAGRRSGPAEGAGRARRHRRHGAPAGPDHLEGRLYDHQSPRSGRAGHRGAVPGGPVTGPPVTESGHDDRPDGDLEVLTGLRSGKRSYYAEYVRSAERLEHAVQALDGISRALVRTAAGPRTLVEWVVRTATAHLQADWLLFVVADGVLPAARPRFLAVTGGELIDDESRLPADVREHLAVLRGRPWEVESPDSGQGWVRVSMTLDDEPVGGIAARPGTGLEVAATDRAILRVLANQAAVALHNSFLFHATTQLRGRSEQLYDATTQARQGSGRAQRRAGRDAAAARRGNAAAGAGRRAAPHRARTARQRDPVRAVHRHDHRGVPGRAGEHGRPGRRRSPSAWCRPRTSRGTRPSSCAPRSTRCTSAADEPPGPLPVMLQRLSTVHRPANLQVKVMLEGQPSPAAARSRAVDAAVDRGSAVQRGGARQGHARAGPAALPGRCGGPQRLRQRDRRPGPVASRPAAVLRMADLSGRHRGLANMLALAEELGGALSIRRSRSGGVLLRLDIPLPLSGPGEADSRVAAEGCGGDA